MSIIRMKQVQTNIYRLRKRLPVYLVILFLCACESRSQNTEDRQVADNFGFAAKQLTGALEKIGDSKRNPRNTEDDGSLRLVRSRDWTSGFFPGNLWYMYEYTQDPIWKVAAQKFTNNLKGEQWNGSNHDLGFKMYCSFGNGMRLAPTDDYKTILLQSAETLISRFNPKVGAIRSWDHNADKWGYPVIIDNLINLELLFWATRASGDSTFYKVAVSHANKTLENHFREDNSSYHVVNYDTLTGKVLDKHTHQGYAHESSWARGQGWALHGYTMLYRETSDTRFLIQAVKVAEFILNNPSLPSDMVPYWDFDAPEIPNEPKDASAAAVIASGLFELSAYANSDQYLTEANKILKSLSTSAYLAEYGENNYFLLKHSTGNKNKNSEVDVPIVYADYYFLEANLRKLKYDKS